MSRPRNVAIERPGWTAGFDLAEAVAQEISAHGEIGDGAHDAEEPRRARGGRSIGRDQAPRSLLPAQEGLAEPGPRVFAHAFDLEAEVGERLDRARIVGRPHDEVVDERRAVRMFDRFAEVRRR